MRRLSVLAVSLFLVVGASAQKLKEGDLSFLKGENKLHVVFDYSDLKIEGKKETVFLEKKGDKWATDWNNAKSEFFEKFTKNANMVLIDKDLDLRIGNFPDAKYQITIKVLTLDDDWDMTTEVYFAKDSKILAVVDLKGSAGKFGSPTNLTGDAMKDAGTRFGKFISKKIK